jgi:ABC-type dipeptide/oligopeptide/nickel transport system permease subunit
LTELTHFVAEEHEPNLGVHDAAQGLTVPSMSPAKMAFKRFLHHRGAVVAAIALIVMALFVILAPITARYGVNEAVFKTSAERSNIHLPPQSIAWFGTDGIGRDLYSRLIYGLRVSLLIGLAAAIFGTIVGVTIGAIAGMRRGWVDDVLMRVTDIFLAFPFLVTLLVMRSLLSSISFLEPVVGKITSIRFVIILFVVFGWMPVARLMRGQVLALREREFIEASRALGANSTRIIVKHLLPNAIGPILVALTFSVSAAIVGEATLGFFGYGPQPGSGATSLGNLVGGARSALLPGYWWMVVFPCVLLVLVALCVNFVGDGLRDATDPKLDMGGGS